MLLMRISLMPDRLYSSIRQQLFDRGSCGNFTTAYECFNSVKELPDGHQKKAQDRLVGEGRAVSAIGRMCLGAFAMVLAGACVGCGLYTPHKDPFTSDAPNPSRTSRQGNYESAIVNHVTCEIAQGLTEAQQLNLPWLNSWGTTVTQTITAEDQTGLAPGVSTIAPLNNVIFPFATGGNVTSAQSFSLNFGGTASANALRTETIQYTFRNSDILLYVKPDTCAAMQSGVLIDGDLKIREFIYDKAVIARLGNASLKVDVPKGLQTWQLPPFNTFTEEITFVAAYGGSFTPTWHLARISANTGANLVVAERTNTNDLIITLGPIKCPPPEHSPRARRSGAAPTEACPPSTESPVQL